MKEQFVTYEIALKLKKLGFDEPCLGYYHINQNYPDGYSFTMGEDTRTSDCTVKAPLYQQAIDWFRGKYRIDIHITFKHQKGNKIDGINSVYYDIEIYRLRGGDAWKEYNFNQISDNYHYSREQAILKAIELVNENMAK
jgi:hypothetical protein